ncbi:efflux RND transporter periplasmic adaptor subunit [Oceaniovalibus sp. ACAM 378]|jgi:membrane fusion protein (multidrug efflux system)|uniref:efflux RND transporter periplasmic adaptor subunit n=1 Tax=Oceaniovalibus sp. ACAM 378 TaxID=2599923 RepID=UPI0011D58A28|nr:efflux RND transporter periplasmic adaptor subunit [Oceaniovalibus sp. ACAM 378]TYB88482.1 efflux RND transporter periplasmic adaptor subunit [Oceaniovalibus sp. ACAM 378]
MKKRLAIAIVLLGLVVGGIVWFNQFRDKMIAEFFAGRKAPPVAVSVVEVEPIAWNSGIDAIGTALSAQGVDLAIEAGGLVRDVLFKANDKVVLDQKLVQIDERIEQADLGAAQASLDLAVTQLERNKTLQERGISTTNTVDTAEVQEKSARAQVAKLTAILDQKEMRAPFSGVIGISKVEPGQYVTPGMIYATLQNLERMQVDFTVPEQEISRVSIGAPVTAKTEAGETQYSGSIIAVEPRVDPVSRLVSVRALIEGTDGTLFPGQFLRVRVTLPVEEGILVLPQTAVSSSLYGDSVFVVRKGEDDALSVTQVFVDVGRRSGSMVEISKGLTAGDEVVNAGQNRLTGGAAVVIDNTVSPKASLE